MAVSLVIKNCTLVNPTGILHAGLAVDGGKLSRSHVIRAPPCAKR